MEGSRAILYVVAHGNDVGEMCSGPSLKPEQFYNARGFAERLDKMRLPEKTMIRIKLMQCHGGQVVDCDTEFTTFCWIIGAQPWKLPAELLRSGWQTHRPFFYQKSLTKDACRLNHRQVEQ